MVKFLYPHFLSDPAEYARAEAYWQQVWDNLIRTQAVQGWRSPWMKSTDANGTPFRDGNPIFTAVSDRERRGVRILQHEPSDPNEVDLDWWVDTFGEGEPAEAVRELVIACVLTEQTARQVADLLSRWVKHEGTPGPDEIPPPPQKGPPDDPG